MKRFLTVFIFTLICLCGYGDEIRIALRSPVSFGVVESFESHMFYAKLCIAIDDNPWYRVTSSGSSVDDVVKISLNGATSFRISAPRQFEKADCFCVGVIIETNGNYSISAHLVSIPTGSVLGSSTRNVSGKKDLSSAYSSVAAELFGTSSGTVGAVSGQDKSASDYGSGLPRANYKETGCGLQMSMVYVQGGEFMMGGTEVDAYIDEFPVRKVTVGDFYIGQYEVTQGEWSAVMGTSIAQQRDKVNPGGSLWGVGPDYPMYYVSWEEASEFCRILSRRTGRTYRLPTEAEWEYAARSGRWKRRLRYSGSNELKDVGWYRYNSQDYAHAVGTKFSNELGIYDMSGNVYEWCSDWYADRYDSYDVNNPTGPSSGRERVMRGGAFPFDSCHAGVSDRSYGTPDYRGYCYGFRVVCIP